MCNFDLPLGPVLRAHTHTLNTVLGQTFSEKNAPEYIKDVVETLENCESLVTFLKRTVAAGRLAHTVIEECKVRWNNKVHTLKSILMQHSDIRQLLENRDQLHWMEGIFEDQLMNCSNAQLSSN